LHEPKTTYQIKSIDSYQTIAPAYKPRSELAKRSFRINHSLPSYRAREQNRDKRNPGLAAYWSALLWGSGHIYADRLVFGLYLVLYQVFGTLSLVLGWRHREEFTDNF